MNIAYIPFIDECIKHVCFCGASVAVIGSQEMHDSAELLEEYAIKNGYMEFKKKSSVRNLFFERYKIKEYTDFDINDSADVKINFGFQIPQDLFNKYDIIFNAGTIEHIFNISQSLENIHNMLKTGGVMLHIVPFSWINHGFYNIDPRLLYGIDASNGYKRIAEGFFYPIVQETNWLKRQFKKDNELCGLKFLRIGNNYTAEAKLIHSYWASSAHKTNVLYLYATQKINNEKFILPYDIQQ